MPFAEWVRLPRKEVAELARRLGDHFGLTDEECRHLRNAMVNQCHEPPAPRYGPFRVGECYAETVAAMASMEGREVNVADELFAINVRLNKPSSPRERVEPWRYRKLGDGLTARSEVANAQPEVRQFLRERSTKAAARPFQIQARTMQLECDKMLWEADYLQISYDRWIMPHHTIEPYTHLIWYAQRVGERLENARAQADDGNIEAAMWHALNAGELLGEMRLKHAHDDFFKKQVETRRRQADAGASTAKATVEQRQAAYWRHRRIGNKKKEAGTLAGLELGVSESTVRNAFPGGRYPAD